MPEIAHQEERPTLLDATRESVANGVGAQVWPVVSDSDYDGGTPPLGTARLSEVDADQLNHVRLQEIDIPDVKKSDSMVASLKNACKTYVLTTKEPFPLR